MNTENVLASIDRALDDFATSEDAMRWVPEAHLTDRHPLDPAPHFASVPGDLAIVVIGGMSFRYHVLADSSWARTSGILLSLIDEHIRARRSAMRTKYRRRSAMRTEYNRRRRHRHG